MSLPYSTDIPQDSWQAIATIVSGFVLVVFALWLFVLRHADRSDPKHDDIVPPPHWLPSDQNPD